MIMNDHGHCSRTNDIDIFEKEQEACCELRENEASQIFSRQIPKSFVYFQILVGPVTSYTKTSSVLQPKLEYKQMILKFWKKI